MELATFLSIVMGVEFLIVVVLWVALSVKQEDNEGLSSGIEDLYEENEDLDAECGDLSDENEKLTAQVEELLDETKVLMDENEAMSSQVRKVYQRKEHYKALAARLVGVVKLMAAVVNESCRRKIAQQRKAEIYRECLSTIQQTLDVGEELEIDEETEKDSGVSDEDVAEEEAACLHAVGAGTRTAVRAGGGDCKGA